MKKRVLVLTLFAIFLMTVSSFARKGSGCPTFSKTTVEQNTVKV